MPVLSRDTFRKKIYFIKFPNIYQYHTINLENSIKILVKHSKISVDFIQNHKNFDAKYLTSFRIDSKKFHMDAI